MHEHKRDYDCVDAYPQGLMETVHFSWRTLRLLPLIVKHTQPPKHYSKHHHHFIECVGIFRNANNLQYITVMITIDHCTLSQTAEPGQLVIAKE
jgi:hypothetical protein